MALRLQAEFDRLFGGFRIGASDARVRMNRIQPKKRNRLKHESLCAVALSKCVITS